MLHLRNGGSIKRRRCRARRFAGEQPDVSRATAAVTRSAASLSAILTPADVAVERAGDAATRLDTYLEAMRRSGALKEFNRQFKRERMEATANGRGFMSYRVAEARLRRALIPMLTGGGRPAVGEGMSAVIFGAARMAQGAVLVPTEQGESRVPGRHGGFLTEAACAAQHKFHDPNCYDAEGSRAVGTHATA